MNELINKIITTQQALMRLLSGRVSGCNEYDNCHTISTWAKSFMYSTYLNKSKLLTVMAMDALYDRKPEMFVYFVNNKHGWYISVVDMGAFSFSEWKNQAGMASLNYSRKEFPVNNIPLLVKSLPSSFEGGVFISKNAVNVLMALLESPDTTLMNWIENKIIQSDMDILEIICKDGFFKTSVLDYAEKKINFINKYIFPSGLSGSDVLSKYASPLLPAYNFKIYETQERLGFRIDSSYFNDVIFGNLVTVLLNCISFIENKEIAIKEN